MIYEATRKKAKFMAEALWARETSWIMMAFKQP